MIDCGKATGPVEHERIGDAVPIGCWSVIRLPVVRTGRRRDVLGVRGDKSKLVRTDPFRPAFTYVMLSDLALYDPVSVPNRVHYLDLCGHTLSLYLLSEGDRLQRVDSGSPDRCIHL